MKKYYTLNQIIKLINNGKMHCVFENRKKQFKFSINNYGDIPGKYNKADGDPWDVFAPGYTKELPHGKFYQINKIIGILFLKNGNHKIAVSLYAPGFKDSLVEKHVNSYGEKYCNYTKIQGHFLYK